MLLARLETDKRIYNIYSDNIESENIKIYGHYFEDGKFYVLNSDIFKEFEKLKLGKNYKNIGKYSENNINYDVILDLDTNLKHYFYNGKENPQMFYHNFRPLIYAQSDDRGRVLLKVGLCLLLSSTIMNLYVHFVPTKTVTVTVEQPEVEIGIVEEPITQNELVSQLNETPELTTEIIKDLINSNQKLSEYDKNIIINDELLNWAVPYINMNKEYSAELYNFILPNFYIEDERLYGDFIGAWIYSDRRILVDTEKINGLCDGNYIEYYADNLRHEFCHLLQPPLEYCFIYEPFTEMISNEFAPYYIHSYPENQKYLKILMEIIGTEPVVVFHFTGDISVIKNELLKYLSEEQTNALLECFKIRDDEENFNKVESILNEAFYNKYGIQMKDSYLIRQYYNFDSEITKKVHYFNNPTENIIVSDIYTVLLDEPVYETTYVDDIDENGNHYMKEVTIEINSKTVTETTRIPKELFLTSQTIDEAKEKFAAYKTR